MKRSFLLNARSLPAVGLLASLVASLSACSGGQTSPAPDAGTDATSSDTRPLPCDVDDVLARQCRTCHSDPPQFRAPMPLTNHGDVVAPAHSDPATPVWKRMGVRIHDDAMPMPQPPNPRLSPADMATLDRWIAAGAPAGSGSCSVASDGGTPEGGRPDSSTPDAQPPVDGGPSTCPDVHLAPATPWAMPQDTGDVYTCYGFDVTTAQKRQAIAITPRIDNTKIVHHILVFQSDTAMSGTPAPCGINNSTGWRMIYGWAPGGQALTLPPEAGFPLEGTTHYVVQIHYNNVNHLAGQTDTTGVDLCTTDQLRPNDADVVAFGSMGFTVDPRSTLDWTCNYTIPSQIAGKLHAFGALPHMHQIGKSISTVDLPNGSGAPVDMGGQPTWNFQTQTWFPIDATLGAGDVIRTRCVWQNPGDNPVSFGEYTADEMCFSFTMYYPKVTAPGWTWLGPASSASCAKTMP